MNGELHFCPHCGTAVQSNDIFCPHCGKQIREPKLSTSIGKQIVIYLVSFFLPPFGLMWTFKYLREKDKKARNTGLASLVLTIIAVIAAIWITVGLINGLNASLNKELNGSQFNQFLQNY